MAADLQGFTEQEALNKVLNTDNNSLQVDIVDATGVTITTGHEYAEDTVHSSGATGSFVLGVRQDSLAALGANGDYVPFQMNASGALYVEAAVESGQIKSGAIASGAVASGAIASGAVASGAVASGAVASGAIASGSISSGAIASGALASGSVVDGAMVTLGAKADAKNAATDATAITAMQVLKQISSSVQILEDWDDSDLANVNLNLSGSDADKGEGVLSSQTLRVSLATNDDGVTHLATIAGDTTSVDGKITACNTGAVVLAAGSAAIGKLAANDGVDIGDVDVTSVVPGYGATNLGKREDDAHSNLDTGVMALAVRNDAIAAIGAADGDYAPLQVNSAGSLYTKDETGEAGSILVKGTNAVAAGISGTVFIAIQFLEDTVFHDDDGLVASSTQLYPDDAGVGSDISSNGGNTDDVVFPQGMTIFGRWAGFKLASGTVIAYVGYV